jgi:hypothetical protein
MMWILFMLLMHKECNLRFVNELIEMFFTKFVI